jgi:integrase
VRERVYPETSTTTWQADIHVKLLDGRRIRERSKVPGATSRGAALKWAEARQRWLILHGHEARAPAPAVPTLAEFGARFVAEYAVANRLKPSSVHNKRTILRNYLEPVLGARRLDEIGEPEVQRLKAAHAGLAPASVNNALTLLSTMLRTAAAWGVIGAAPTIRKLKQPGQRFEFYDEETYERLVAAAGRVDPTCLRVVLLGGDAGLRGGEILALRLRHCDLRRGVIHVEENEWQGHVGSPKGNRARQVVMTSRLRLAARGQLGQRAAGLPAKGPHVLRHTFCSRLAASGAAPRAIQELAGHLHSSTTDRYLHLAPAALRTAIGLLERR